MSHKPFDKFINKEAKGAKKKEAFRQEKRRGKAEARALGEELRKKKLDKKRGILSPELAPKSTPIKATKRGKIPQLEVVSNPNEKEKKKRFNKKSLLQNIAPADAAVEADIDLPVSDTLMPLNKFIAHAGICGRREAADLIRQGLVQVNGDKVVEPGYKVRGNEDVKVKGKKIFLQKNLVYILLNKPKDYITTAKDPEGRKTVLDLIKGATKERVYSVGRLDRNTTGVLLLTNDGELAQKLTHPSYEIKKIYEVRLDKPLVKKDFEAIATGITLEDGFVKADSLAYDEKDKSIVGIEIHSGRNRIVRRMFEHLGYDVKNLDRVMFANLTKKNVDRGTWRMLQPKEIRLLKFMNQSFLKKETSTKGEKK